MMNVIYIIADQLRWDTLGCNGAAFMKTPNTDRLAREGVNFSCTYSGNPVCVPARGIMGTGCYSHVCMDPAAENGNGGAILPHHVHIAELLRQNGYGTYGIGKCHCVPYKTNPGFDIFEVAEEGRLEQQRQTGVLSRELKENYIEYLREAGWGDMQRAHGIGNNDPRAGAAPLPEEHYVDTWATTRALECLDEHRQTQPERPFYLQLGFVKPHAPYDPPEPWNRMYDPREIPSPWGSVSDLEGRNPAMSLFPSQYLIDRMSPMAIQYSRAHYFGLVSFLDSQIGRLLEYLETNGIIDDTVIVFTSDHGDNIGDHGLFFKTFFTEGSAHIPLLFRAPNTPSSCFDKPVAQEDIMPTICDLIGIEIPNPVDGVSLKRIIEGQSTSHKPFVISQHYTGDRMTLMLREEQFKYCFARYEATEELYDMANDPHELANLAGSPDHAHTVNRLRNLAEQWCRENNHDPLFDDHGTLRASRFDAHTLRRPPSKTMGFRPW